MFRRHWPEEIWSVNRNAGPKGSLYATETGITITTQQKGDYRNIDCSRKMFPY